MMSENFTLSAEDPRKLFRRPSRATKARQMIYSKAKAAEDKPVPVADLVRDNPEFHSAEIYRAAKVLVTHGVLTRSDISWAALEKGTERTCYRCAVKYVEPFTEASRVW
jgi:hypothetical protein